MFNRFRTWLAAAAERKRQRDLDALRAQVEYYQAMQREVAREISRLMAQPLLGKMRRAGS